MPEGAGVDDSRRLADELAIRNVIARLAHLADDALGLDEYVALFTEDATWELPGAARTGRSDIAAGAVERRSEGLSGPGSGTKHVISTVAVRSDGSDVATATSYFEYYADTTTAPRVTHIGRYDDTFVREPGGWRLQRRAVRFG